MGFIQIGVAGLASGCIGIFNSHTRFGPVAVLSASSMLALPVLLAEAGKPWSSRP
jgi:hypothetical protein